MNWDLFSFCIGAAIGALVVTVLRKNTPEKRELTPGGGTDERVPPKENLGVFIGLLNGRNLDGNRLRNLESSEAITEVRQMLQELGRSRIERIVKDRWAKVETALANEDEREFLEERKSSVESSLSDSERTWSDYSERALSNLGIADEDEADNPQVVLDKLQVGLAEQPDPIQHAWADLVEATAALATIEEYRERLQIG